MQQFTPEWLAGKQVVVLGLAKSGLSAALRLKRYGAQVLVNDIQPEDKQPPSSLEALRQAGIKGVWGGHPEYLIHPGVHLVVKNPGIPYRNPLVRKSLDLGIPVITEAELAFAWSRAPIIGITGSNGKTTTTSWVGKMLMEDGRQVEVVGNIGRVMSEVAAGASRDSILVAELSSFQLKGTRHFRPRVGALLNLYPAHLDYHETMEDYLCSKLNLFANQQHEDISVWNTDEELWKTYSANFPSRRWGFGLHPAPLPGVYAPAGVIQYHTEKGEVLPLLPTRDLPLMGQHNLLNALAASAIALASGARVEAVQRALQNFQGVEHRLEFVREINGVRYYNDSKSTNSQAARVALRSFDQGLTWIAGGLDRGGDFDDLLPDVQKHVKRAVLFGQTAEKIASMCQKAGLTEIYFCHDVHEAVEIAARITPEKEVVLLSPACASWDMYTSFEERGHIFKQAVHML